MDNIEELKSQLKRKEQECEELKENYKNAMTSLDAFVRNCADLSCKKLNIEKKYKKEICKQQKSIVKLKAENDELKKIIERLDVPKHEVIDMDIALENEKFKAENEKLDTENKRLVAELANPVFDSFEELDQLKQTLTEIKEIAEENKETTQYRGICLSILQKINECEGNDE